MRVGIMAIVLFRMFALCIVGLAVLGTTFASVEVTKLTATSDNVYVGEIKSVLQPVGNDTSISLTVPVLKDLDDSFQAKANVNVSNIPILNNYVTPLCEAIKEPFFKPAFDKLEPKEKLPLKCPITAGEWKLVDFIIKPSDYIPFSVLANMDFHVKLEISKPNESPAVKLEWEGLVKAPGGNFDLSSLLPVFR